MSALSFLQQKNGLKTTQDVVTKQQSGVDAEEKANPQVPPTFTEEQLDTMGKQIDKENTAVPQDDAMKAAREKTIATQQAISKGENVSQSVDPDDADISSVPVVKKEEQPKRMSYVDMFKTMNGNEEETDAQKAKRLKRERTNAIIASVGDGLRALSNMYFATKGAKVAHNPEQDMTAAMLKRKQIMDAQREKNHSAWLSGYQKAVELDEQARKNDQTLGETVRYHNALVDIANRKGDQNDKKLDQNQQKIDLAKMKYTNDKEYKDNRLTLDKWYKENKISIDEYNAATARLRAEKVAAKAASSSKGNKGNAGYWYEYWDMMDDPNGQKQITDVMRKIRAKGVNQNNIRYIMDKVKGRSSSTADGGGKKPSQHRNTTGGTAKNGKRKKARPY